MKHLKYILVSLIAGAALASCENSEQDFPDFDGGTKAYFAYQYPVRTITLGEDPEQDNTLDNSHRCRITATHGGSYEPRDAKMEIEIDNTLTDNLYFENGTPVKPMPEDYYRLSSNKLTHIKSFLYGSEIELTDKFFADPASLENTYVIPARIIKADGCDGILTGSPVFEGDTPSPCDATAWKVQPKDYVLYCVKYINPWHATYLRRGVDIITEDGGAMVKYVRRSKYRESDEVVSLTTGGYNVAKFPVKTQVSENGGIATRTCVLDLTFDGDNCTISTSTHGMTASGSGKFVKDGEKKGWGNQDHNVLYLEYNIDFGGKTYNTIDTLVVQSRNIVMEEFNPIYKVD